MISDLSVRATARDDVLVQEIEGKAVLLHIQSETYFGIDDVGTRMWSVLISSESLERAYETLLSEYEVEPALLRNDLAQFVERLVEHDLIRLESPEASF